MWAPAVTSHCVVTLSKKVPTRQKRWQSVMGVPWFSLIQWASKIGFTPRFTVPDTARYTPAKS